MNRAQLLREVLLGRLLIVGEFRGAHAAMDGYVDRTTGEKVGYVKAILLAECTVWAAFGEGWEPTKVKDLIKESLFSTVYRACRECADESAIPRKSGRSFGLFVYV